MAKWKPELGERYLYPCIHGCKVSYDFDTWQNRQIDKDELYPLCWTPEMNGIIHS